MRPRPIVIPGEAHAVRVVEGSPQGKVDANRDQKGVPRLASLGTTI